MLFGTTGLSQITLPVFASSATMCASDVPVYTLSPYSAMARFTLGCVPCGSLREGVSREIAARVFEAVRRAGPS